MGSSRGNSHGVAVVTGGTAGIGRATVRELAARGWDVGIIARGKERLDATVGEVKAAGRRGLACSADVADHEAVERAAQAIEDELGPIELHDAFTGAIAFFDDVTPEEYERITMATYIGFVNGTRAALKRMKARNRGTVVQVGSALAFRGIPLQSAYCGAKHAINGQPGRAGAARSVPREDQRQGPAVQAARPARAAAQHVGGGVRRGGRRTRQVRRPGPRAQPRAVAQPAPRSGLSRRRACRRGTRSSGTTVTHGMPAPVLDAADAARGGSASTPVRPQVSHGRTR
jgi:NAD(P)-dependent dehydrogenase (short-subunit alcohol dehydrogenase family)